MRLVSASLALLLSLGGPVFAESGASVQPAKTPQAEILPAEEADPAEKTEEPKRYVRVRRGEEGRRKALQTSILEYDLGGPHKGVVVTLVSAVHIGESSYYSELQQRFSEFDVVLYELIAPEGHRKYLNQKSAEGAESSVSALQRSLKQFLKLEMQLEAMDYTHDNFVHADLTPEQLIEEMNKRGENFLTLLLRLVLASYSQMDEQKQQVESYKLLFALLHPDKARAMKRVLADQFEDIDNFVKFFGGPGGEIIIGERNDAALEVLKQELKAGKKKIAIFYGAAHMPDMRKKLMDSFHAENERLGWVDAWDLS